MANQQDLTVWKNRWDALDKTIDSYYQRLDTYYEWLQELKPPVPRKETLQCLVRCLQAFAKGQFDFFFDGFGFGKQVQYKLREDPNYPSAYVLWVILDQISSDLGVVQQAVVQRLWGPDKMTDALETADALAWLALQPVSAKLDPHTTIVTYLQKFPAIRVIPYAPVALIGVPFTCTSVPQDHLAIPHEVGHYLFWRGELARGEYTPNRALFDRLKKELGWYAKWVEEIFADVYGCLIAGPVIALASQDLQRRYSLKKFVRDDEEHPVPMLRPHVYTKALDKQSHGTQAKELDKRWLAHREERDEHRKPEDRGRFEIHTGHRRHIDEAIGFTSDGSSKDYSFIDVNKPVDKVINEILELPGVKGIDPGWWSDYLRKPGSTSHEKFAKHLADLISSAPSPPPPFTECSTDGLWEKWAEERFNLSELLKGKEIKVEAWLPVLRADGWITKIASSWGH